MIDKKFMYVLELKRSGFILSVIKHNSLKQFFVQWFLCILVCLCMSVCELDEGLITSAPVCIKVELDK